MVFGHSRHQKLGTYAGNEIDVAIVLPYAALPSNEIMFCQHNKWLAPRCMVEVGINNVLGMFRTDTPYLSTDPKILAARNARQIPSFLASK